MTAAETLPRVVRVDVVTVPSRPVPTRSRRRRARSTLLIAVAVYVLAQAGWFAAIDTEAVPVRDPIYAEKFALLKGHPAFLAEDSQRPRVLAVGSSRTLLAVDAERMGTKLNADAFNFGCHGCGPITNALYLRRLLDAGVRAETVLLEIHPAMFADHDPPYEHRFLHPYRLRRSEIDTLHGYGWRVERPEQYSPTGWLTASHTYRIAALDRYAPALLPCPFGMTLAGRTDRFGFVSGDAPVGADRANALVREYVTYLPAFEKYRPGGPAVEALRDMIRQCQSRGFRPVLVLTAESSEFRGWYDHPAAVAFSRRIADETGVALLDASKWIADADFADGHHLTAAGARTFTDRLAEELRR